MSLALFALPVATYSASSVSLEVFPSHVTQGEPILVEVHGVSGTSSVKRISLNGAPLGVFTYRGGVAAFAGVDLHQKPDTYALEVELMDGAILKSEVRVVEREHVEAPLGIPQKLGGNTAQSQQTLIDTLAAENASLAQIRTGVKAFWTDSFVWPLKSITMTDPYGYSRQTGAYSIAHKGVDFRAAEGTPVMAINRGVVRVAKTYRDYGKTVVVDHGLGLMSFYMHLSKIKVNVGELVLPGQVVALSGQTGYAEMPHLHLTVRIGGVSVDPMKFMDLFNL